MDRSGHSTLGQIVGLLIFLGLCALVAGIGSVVSMSAMDSWYGNLEQPNWNPPDWVFGPVWSVLYLMIAISGWLVWRARGWTAAQAQLIVWGIQLALNLLWTVLFFGLEQPGLAAIEIVLLWVAIFATINMFWPISSIAAALLVPYLIWVTYATLLTISIWRLN